MRYLSMHVHLKHALARLLIAALCAFSGGAAYALPSIVVDARTGMVLEQEDAFKLWSPASLTKLMTAYATFKEIESGNLTLQSPVRISSNAANNPASRMGYPVGTIVTLDNALTMMLVKSANDIAVAIGESVSGNEPAFVDRMNAEAARLGMIDTHFANPNGLNDGTQFSTARDLAILAAAIRREFPQYDSYFSTEAIRYGDTVLPTYNLLIGRFDGADGMKTGFVCESGFNLVASATRNGTTLIAVVLGEFSSKTRAEKAAVLLEKGFAAIATGENYPLVTDLARPAGLSSAVADMRPAICSEEARSKRWEGREAVGDMTFATPSIKPLTRDLVAVTVKTGGATGSSGTATTLLGRVVKQIPVPENRPERVSLVDDEDRVNYGLRPGFDVPVPDQRPET
jgi:D-alanyl-D-alanine carboxypeptidase